MTDTPKYIVIMSKGWTIYNESGDKAIHINDDGTLMLSFDGQATWDTVGQLTDPTSTAVMLLDMLGVEKRACN